MVTNWQGPPAMLAIFRKLYGSFSCPHIIKQNNFSNLQHYFLQKVSIWNDLLEFFETKSKKGNLLSEKFSNDEFYTY